MPPRTPSDSVTLNGRDIDLGNGDVFTVVELNDPERWAPGTLLLIPPRAYRGGLTFLPPTEGVGAYEDAFNTLDWLPRTTILELLERLGYEELLAPEVPAPELVADVMDAAPAEVTLEQFKRLNAHEVLVRQARSAGAGGTALDRYYERVCQRVSEILQANGPGARAWRVENGLPAR